jgi:hypothetical protein
MISLYLKQIQDSSVYTDAVYDDPIYNGHYLRRLQSNAINEYICTCHESPDITDITELPEQLSLYPRVSLVTNENLY